MKFFKVLTKVSHLSLLSLIVAAFATSTSLAESKRLNLRLTVKSKIESTDFSPRKQEKTSGTSKLGTPLIKDYFDDVDSYRTFIEMNALDIDDPEREAISRRYMRSFIGKQIGGLLKDSELRKYYIEAQNLAEKSRDALKYDPSTMKPEDVTLEVPITFGVDVSRGIAPTLRAGDHLQLTLNPFLNRIMLDTEWRY